MWHPFIGYKVCSHQDGSSVRKFGMINILIGMIPVVNVSVHTDVNI